MIKISHELPLSLFPYSSDWNDYEYCLPHLLDKHEEYRQFFLDTNIILQMDQSIQIF